MVAFFFPAVRLALRPATMIATIQDLGLTSGLKLCLDAGDINSYSGSGQSWLDTSGNGYDFFRGTTSASQSSDPTFNGTAGRESSSEYWSFDGGDLFTYDSSNETWMNNLHKDNALHSQAMWVYVTAYPASVAAFMGTKRPGSGSSDRGVSTLYRSGGDFRFNNIKDSGTVVLQITTTATIPLNAWTFLGVTLNEPAGTAVLQINGTQESFTGTYSSPSTSNASQTMTIGAAGGDLSFAMLSGTRIANASFWESVALTAGQLDSIFQATRARFGI